LGFPVVELKLSSDQPEALLAARLCDLAPDGTSRLVSWGLLNLTHRQGHIDPEPLVPGKFYAVSMQLNVVAHHLEVGHRWRLALSPTYWPHAWPSPQAVTLILHTGSDCKLVLPLRLPSELDRSLAEFSLPEGASPLEYEDLRPEASSRTITFEEPDGRLQMVDRFDHGRNHILSNGIVYDSLTTNIYSIVEEQPLSARVQCDRRIEISRGEWHIRVETTSVMTSDAGHFHLTNNLDAYEGQVRVFTRSYTRKIPRECV
jgi:hypothetical protein